MCAHFAKDVGRRIGVQFLQLLVGSVAGIVIARSLGPTQRGSLAVVMLAATILQAVLSAGLPQSLWYCAGRRAFPWHALWSFITLYAGIFSALSMGVLYLVAGTGWKAFQGVSSMEMLLAGAGSGVALWVALGRPVLAGIGSMSAVNVVDVLAAVSYLVGGVILCWFLELGVVGALVAYGGSNLLGAMGVATVGRLELSTRCREVIRAGVECVSYGVRASIGLIAQLLTYRLDIFFVNYFHGPSAAGAYAVAAAFSEIAAQPAVGVQTIGFAYFGGVLAGQTGPPLAVTTRSTVVVTALIGLLWIPAGYIAIPILFGDAYRDAVTPSGILVVGMIALAGVKVLYAYVVAGLGRPLEASLALLMGFLVTVGLDLLLIPTFGVRGAAGASVVAYWTCLVFLTRTVSRHAGVRWTTLLLPHKADLRVVLQRNR